MRIANNLYGPDSYENEVIFEDLVTQNQEKITNLIFGMTGNYHLAQDLAQDTFIKAFQALKNFNGKSKISTWLYRIAVNTVIDYQRKSCVRNENPEPEIEKDSDNSFPDPDQACQKKAIKDLLFAAVSQLPDQQREVFVLREINGCSTKEVAEILDCSGELVKWRLHKSRSALRKILQNDNKYGNNGTYVLTGTGIE